MSHLPEQIAGQQCGALKGHVEIPQAVGFEWVGCKTDQVRELEGLHARSPRNPGPTDWEGRGCAHVD